MFTVQSTLDGTRIQKLPGQERMSKMTPIHLRVSRTCCVLDSG